MYLWTIPLLYGLPLLASQASCYDVLYQYLPLTRGIIEILYLLFILLSLSLSLYVYASLTANDIAISDSVTVSIGLLTNGVCSLRLRVNALDIS